MATQYFTDKNLVFNKREVFPAAFVPAAIKLKCADTPSVTDFKGFGVAITGASCYLLNEMKKEERTELLKNIYSKDGIGLSVGRLCVGSSDYSAELYSYDDVPFDTELTHFSIERDEKYIIPMIKEILKVNPDIYLFASPWSPPGWMKTGGNMCGGYMREEYIECYAEYIIKFIKAYADHGIKISALTPQNEAETQQKGRMPACIWHPEMEAKFIKILKEKLAENNLDVKIWMYDHAFDGIDRVLWSLEKIDGLANNCDGVAFHYYHGDIEDTVQITKEFPNLELHFTEGGPRLYDNYDTDWCKWSMMITKALKCGYKSFTGWNLMLDEMGGPNIGPFFCGGLVTRNSITGELNFSGQYKAFKHVAPYITADSKIYPLTSDEPGSHLMFPFPQTRSLIEGFMIDNGTGKPIYVLINANDEKKQTQFYAKGTWWYVELMPDTVSTIVF